MSFQLRQRLFDALDAIVLIDPHTHIDPHQPAGRTLTDILGYHYYTELIHSAGVSRSEVERPGSDPKERFGRLVEGLAPLENTIQYSWLIELAQSLFGFQGDRLTPANWEPLYDEAARRMDAPNWPQEVLQKSKIEAVFLTNDFDDPLTGFDTKTYVPCLRTDDLVFHLDKPAVRERLERASGVAVTDEKSLRDAIGRLFEHFVKNGARACAISLPPDFIALNPFGEKNATIPPLPKAVQAVWHSTGERRVPFIPGYATTVVTYFVFWTLAEYCQEFHLPFDLMIGVNRGVYEGGVHQGRDLYDSRVSLIQYKQLFNAFPRVTFPISVLASVTNQELTSYAWIFPNVVTNGHWWYSNTPTFVEHDLSARLEAVPATKQVGYYSDMYKLEFALPKFAMYKRLLAKVLAERFVVDRGWSEERAVDLGRQVLRGNVERVFYGAGEAG
ncbi:MAG TPA: glucuronate isomerase [Pirellulales bacterium]|jgi:glucuronate isomerase|nr:glucuronate isomerase [Pirellulales bacterium]